MAADLFMRVEEVAEVMGVSVSYAYKIIPPVARTFIPNVWNADFGQPALLGFGKPNRQRTR